MKTTTTVVEHGGTPSTGPVVSEMHAKNGLRICQYIDTYPRCSCKECNIFVDRDGGNILCCNQHMFAPDEIAAAKLRIKE